MVRIVVSVCLAIALFTGGYLFGRYVSYLDIYNAREAVKKGTHVWAVNDGWPCIIRKPQPKKPSKIDEWLKDTKKRDQIRAWENGRII